MLLRDDGHGVLAIGQASHAWVSGQLARAWGNERFGTVEPYEEVCLAAEQHDVGMAEWDLAPERNPGTGLPYSFMEMPLATHLELWRAGPPRLVAQSRYAALLVGMHGYRLYEHRDLTRLTPSQANDVRAFLREQRVWQQELLASLHADPGTAPSAREEVVRRNSDLIWTWDFMSLALCLGWPPRSARDVPLAPGAGATEIELVPAATATEVALDPWPFRADEVVLRCEGRRFSEHFATDTAFATTVATASWETLEIRLVPLSP